MIFKVITWLPCILLAGGMHAEVTFRADFNERLDAALAKGDAAPKMKGEVRYVEGIEGKAAVLRNENQLSYQALENVSIESGTVSMWVKPLNWDWQVTEFVDFFRLDDLSGDRSSLKMYKYMKPGKDFGMVALIGRMEEDGGKPLWVVAREKINLSGRDKWAHLALTWSASQRLVRLYFNGEEIAYRTISEELFPQQLAEQFYLLNTLLDPRNDSYETAVDLLEIHEQPVSSDEIKSLYQRYQKSEGEALALESIQRSTLTVPILAEAPEIDGHYGANEWGAAATVTGFSVFKQPRTPAGQQTTVHVAYDKTHLYVAYLSIIPQGAEQAASAKDGNDLKGFSTDDSVELLVSPDEGEGAVYQLMVNPKGVIAGLKGEHFAQMRAGWKPDVKVASHVYEGRWLVELAVPLKELGLDREEARKNARLNFCRSWAGLDSTGSALATSWSFSDTSFSKDLAVAHFGKGTPYANMSIDSDALAVRRLTGSLAVRNPDSLQAVKATTRVQLLNPAGEPAGTQEKRIEIAPLSEASVPYDLAIELSESVADLSIVRADGEVLLTHQFPLQYPKGLSISPVVRADTSTLEVHVQYAGLVQADLPVEGQVELKTQAGAILAKAPLEATAQSGEAKIDLKAIEDGRYQLATTITQQGREVESHIVEFEKMLNPIWLKEKPGISRMVLPPWTPIEVKGASVSLWGRTYSFAGGILPTAITSAGQQVLKGPAEIELVTKGGKAVTLEPTETKFQEVAEDRVVIASELKGEGVRLKAITTIEYDGMAKVELSLLPEQPGFSVELLRLRFPLSEEPEMFIHAHSFAWSQMIRERLRDGFHSRFFPYVWIGGDDRGLAWFTESDQHWATNRVDHVIETERKGDTRLLTINMIDRPTDISQPVSYVFGYQATPVKPLLAARQKLRLHSPALNIVSPWAMRDKSLKHYQKDDAEWGWLAPHVTNYDGLREELQHWKGRGVTLPIYIAPTITTPHSPAYQLFKEQWRNPHGSYPFACAGSSFTDEVIWQVNEMREKSGVTGVYIDCGWAYSCGNQHHGCGYVDAEGRVRLTYPIFALREEFKRLYTLFHTAPNENPAPMWVHASGLAAAPVHSFVDSLLQGEEVRTDVIANPQYFEIYTLDTWRVTYGPGLGISMSFLPEFTKPVPEEIRYSDDRNAAFVAMALLHDTSIMEGFSSPAYLAKVYRALDAEGFRNQECQFLPYWKQQFVKLPEGTGLKASVYTLPGHALVVIANPGKESVSVAPQFNLESIGWKAGRAEASLLIANQGAIDADGVVTVRSENFVVLKVVAKN